MKIKLAICCSDQTYSKRLSMRFLNKYSEHVEVYQYSDVNIALGDLSPQKIDVFICDSDIDVDFSSIPRKCGFAFLTDSTEIETVRRKRTICRFQKTEMIYKEILSIYSENVSELIGYKNDSNSARLVLITSPAGGTGTSTIAAACAKSIAAHGYRALYIAIGGYESTDCYFNGVGNSTLHDLIFLVKSNKSNFAMKLESIARTDESGAFFIASSENALDIQEITSAETDDLILAIKDSGMYDFVIVDSPMEHCRIGTGLVKSSFAFMVITDGTEHSNNKVERLLSSIRILDDQTEDFTLGRTRLIYNRFNTKNGEYLDEYKDYSLGNIPAYNLDDARQISSRIAKEKVFDSLI